MRITSNPVGNYGPGYVGNAGQTEKTVRTGQRENGPSYDSVQNAVAVRAELPASAMQPQSITSEEKNFFISMYPESKKEIDLHFYQRSGKMAGVSVGSLIDRRG